jgi:hypothetical protein
MFSVKFNCSINMMQAYSINCCHESNWYWSHRPPSCTPDEGAPSERGGQLCIGSVIVGRVVGVHSIWSWRAGSTHRCLSCAVLFISRKRRPPPPKNEFYSVRSSPSPPIPASNASTPLPVVLSPSPTSAHAPHWHKSGSFWSASALRALPWSWRKT